MSAPKREGEAAERSPEPRGQQRRVRIGLAQAALVSDVACIVAAVCAAYYTRASIGPPLLKELQHPLSLYLATLPAVVAILLATGYSLSLYGARLPEVETQIALVWRTNLLGTLLLAGASFLSHLDYSRFMLGLFWLYATIFELGGRSLLALARERGVVREAPVKALIVGTGELAGLVAEKLARAPAPGYECEGFVTVESAAQGDVVGTLEELPELSRDLGIEEVFVAAPGLATERLMPVVERCRDLRTHFYLVAGPLQVLMGSGALADLSQLPVIELPGAYAPSRLYLAAKRLMDLVVGAALLILLAPMMLVVAWIVRRQTHASALFLQERVGQGGRLFRMCKFRTMDPGTDPYAPAPSGRDDPRVTPIGRWLRRYSLDELPQLINVVKGEMSLVGPRPEMPFIVERYEPWQRRRLDAKPGLTGLWQIMGRKDLPLADNIEYDFYYLRHQGLLLDLEILLRTLPAVLLGRGAY